MADLLVRQLHNLEIKQQEDVARAVFIRIHSYQNRMACGTIRSLVMEGEMPFQGLDQMLLIIEELLDREKVIRPSMDYRYVSRYAMEDGWLNHTSEVRNEKPYLPGNLLIQVYGRENRSLQGMMQIREKRIGFRSGMELIRLLHQYLKYSGEKESVV